MVVAVLGSLTPVASAASTVVIGPYLGRSALETCDLISSSNTLSKLPKNTTFRKICHSGATRGYL